VAFCRVFNLQISATGRPSFKGLLWWVAEGRGWRGVIRRHREQVSVDVEGGLDGGVDQVGDVNAIGREDVAVGRGRSHRRRPIRQTGGAPPWSANWPPAANSAPGGRNPTHKDAPPWAATLQPSDGQAVAIVWEAFALPDEPAKPCSSTPSGHRIRTTDGVPADLANHRRGPRTARELISHPDRHSCLMPASATWRRASSIVAITDTVSSWVCSGDSTRPSAAYPAK
jgi:hypothetical protein